MVADGFKDYYIHCMFEKNLNTQSVEYGCDLSTGRIRRRIKLNGINQTSRSSVIGNLVSVIFSPSDIMIVDGNPQIRRKFLDMVISNHDPEYLKALIQYNRSLRQRNTLIKRIRENKARLSDLDPWDAAISGEAVTIMEKRDSFIEDFNPIFRNSLERISGNSDVVRISVASKNESAMNFQEILFKNRLRDVAAGFTTIGPHRHSIEFADGTGHEITNVFSQGQKRSMVLSLRMAQFYFLKRSLRYSPVLLIDDVIRELDAIRRSAFVELLHESGQTIFTTPDMDGLEDFLAASTSEYEIFKISTPGMVERI